jgi:hypothetical protein
MTGTLQHVWISDPAAGPLVVVRKALLDFWGGDSETGRDGLSDCARARAVRELGALDMKGGSALVLGDGPTRTTWLPKPQGGMFVRWVSASNEAAALAATDAGADATWMPTGCTFATGGGAHVLFPASSSGATAREERLAFELPEGDYDILCSVLETADASVLVYRLMWRPRARRRP